MYIESEEINGEIEAVLHMDNDSKGVVLPKGKNEKGEKFISIPYQILNYMENEQKGWVDEEAKKEV